MIVGGYGESGNERTCIAALVGGLAEGGWIGETYQIHEHQPQRRLCLPLGVCPQLPDVYKRQQSAEQETAAAKVSVAAIGGADGPTEINVTDKVDLWKPVINELQSLDVYKRQIL